MALPTNGTYPVQLTFPDSNKVANWRPLAHWLMYIPHYIVAYVLSLVGSVVLMLSWFIIVITGKLPEGLANFTIMTQRYTMRTYGFLLGLTEDYPPFSFDSVNEDPGDHSIQLSVQPQLTDRSRLTVFFRIIMLIPLMIVGYFYFLIAGIVMFVAWFAVLLTGKYPTGMRSFTMNAFRFGARTSAYFGLLTDQYPPFGLNVD